MDALKATLEKKDFASKNVYKTFEDSPHGYAAGRADVSRGIKLERIKS